MVSIQSFLLEAELIYKKVTLKSTMSSQNTQTSEGKCEGSLQIKITVMGCLIKT